MTILLMVHFSRHRFRIFLFDAVLFVFCLLGVYRVAQRADAPVTLTRNNGQVVVKGIDSSAEEIGLRAGDRIRSVNGHALSSPKDMEFLLDGLEIGDDASFEIERDTVLQDIPVTLIPYYGTFYLIIQLIVGSLFFFLGLLVWVKRPDNEAAYVFHWASIAVALVIMTTWGRYTIPPFGLGHSLHLLFSTANAFAPVLFVHFTFLFPRRKWSSTNTLLPLYGFATMLSLWMGATFLLSAFPLSLDWFHRCITAYNVGRWFFSGCIVLAVVSFIHSYRTAMEESERRKLRWVMLGLTIAPLSFVTLWQIPILLTSNPFIREEMLLLISAVVPITFAVSIVRYRLMNIDLIFHRSTVYTLVLAVLLTIYALVVGTVVAIIGVSSIASLLAAIVVALLFEPVRGRVRQFVDQCFFRVQYNFREAQRQFAEKMKDCLDVQQVADVLIGQIDELLQVERIGFFTVQQPEGSLRLLAHRNYDMLATKAVRFETEKLKIALHLPMALDNKIEPGVPFEPATADLFCCWETTLVFAMMSKNAEILGFLFLGDKKSGVRFSIEDIDLLHAVTTQAGLAIEQITLQQKLLIERAETQRLEEVNRLKSEFVSSVSHELKTPLTSIKMFVEILQSQKDIPTEGAQEYLGIIAGESDRLTQLIDKVLDFAKVEGGVKEYHFSEVNPNEVVRTVLQSLQYQFKMQQFTVDVRLSEPERIIHADWDAVVGALTNLLSNAMKYSQERKQMTVSTFCQEGFFAIQVEDKGIGIADDDLKNIFEPFYRARDKKVQPLGGTGLGLTLVRHVMEAHDGKINVRSTPGEGSTFTLLFPMEAHHEAHSRY